MLMEMEDQESWRGVGIRTPMLDTFLGYGPTRGIGPAR